MDKRIIGAISVITQPTVYRRKQRLYCKEHRHHTLFI